MTRALFGRCVVLLAIGCGMMVCAQDAAQTAQSPNIPRPSQRRRHIRLAHLSASGGRGALFASRRRQRCRARNVRR